MLMLQRCRDRHVPVQLHCYCRHGGMQSRLVRFKSAFTASVGYSGSVFASFGRGMRASSISCINCLCTGEL